MTGKQQQFLREFIVLHPHHSSSSSYGIIGISREDLTRRTTTKAAAQLRASLLPTTSTIYFFFALRLGRITYVSIKFSLVLMFFSFCCRQWPLSVLVYYTQRVDYLGWIDNKINDCGGEFSPFS